MLVEMGSFLVSRSALTEPDCKYNAIVLVVSPEGVLVFFTDKEIIATLGCNNSYHWISGNVINVEGRTIKNIEVCEDYCKVILLDDNEVEHSFSLKFDFDGTSYQILNPKVLKL